MPAHYPFKEIESRWQKQWEDSGLYRTPTDAKDPYYVLVMFAYPSGDIHMGHFRNYIVGDAVARKKMMEGKDVLHPFGWDAFGLPAENAAIKRGIKPQEWTESNIAVSRTTLKKVGISYDWDREVVTCRPDYYKWNQWIFLKLFESGLVYRHKSEVNWCPSCQTVLANEQVVDGECNRCCTKVEKRSLDQWCMRITDYAQRLLDDLDTLPGWPDNVKTMQRNWIGRSVGLEADFRLEHNDRPLRIYTTRPDTIYGVTFMVLAPESDYVADLQLDGDIKANVETYIEQARLKGDTERSAAGEKDGIFTGRYAINPFSGERIQVWIADYVLAGYGTGAIMAVPAHDERDFAFARRYDLPVKVVLKAPGGPLQEGIPDEAYTSDEAEMVNSGPFNGQVGKSGIEATIAYAESEGFGKRAVHFRLRDWGVSRQRYWGTPIPIIHCPACGLVPVPESDLPVKLPEGDIDFLPKGRSPLADVDSFMTVVCPACGGKAQRDPDTMDTFVDSSWYFLRYLDPHNDSEPFSRHLADQWLPVHKYIGGITHATGHLMYFRFVTKVLYDKGLLPVPEPSVELFNHGMVLDGQGQVMSKSVGNVVSPVRFMDTQGVDVARLTMFFASPAEKELLWSDAGAVGSARYLDRLWRLFEVCVGRPQPDLKQHFNWRAMDEASQAAYRKLNWTIQKVTDDYEAMQFNTGLAALMELLNEIGSGDQVEPVLLGVVLARTVQLLAPLAPHFAEEAWQNQLGFGDSIFRSKWPTADATALQVQTITLAVQVNGKLRSQLEVAADITEEQAVKTALADVRVSNFTASGDIQRTIFVPGRLLNFVVKPG
jgi:leucyl-tRNA synthetase